MIPRLLRASIGATWFWVGVVGGVLFEQQRGFGTDYWRRQAVLAAQLAGQPGPMRDVGAP